MTNTQATLSSRITPQPDREERYGGASSGPVFLILTNLAHGTSADDITAALAGFWGLVHCFLHSADSSRAILLFEEYRFAARAQEHFDNAVADGNLLTARFLTPEESDALSLVARTQPAAVAQEWF